VLFGLASPFQRAAGVFHHAASFLGKLAEGFRPDTLRFRLKPLKLTGDPLLLGFDAGTFSHLVTLVRLCPDLFGVSTPLFGVSAPLFGFGTGLVDPTPLPFTAQSPSVRIQVQIPIGRRRRGLFRHRSVAPCGR